MRQFVKSMKRLYDHNRIPKEKIIQLFTDGKISENEKEYILGA